MSNFKFLLAVALSSICISCVHRLDPDVLAQEFTQLISEKEKSAGENVTIQNVQGHFDNGHYKGYAYGLFNGNDVVYEIEAYYIGDSVVHNFALTKERANQIGKGKKGKRQENKSVYQRYVQ